MKNRKQAIALILSASLFAAGCSSAVATDAEVPEEAPVAVEISTAALSTIKNEMTYAGRINPQTTISVMSKMSGKVKETYFDVGDRVTANDVLFALDEVDINNQIRQLQSQLNLSQQGIQNAQNSLNTITGGQFESQVLQLTTGIENSKKQLESAEIGLENSKIAYENSKIALENAQDALNNAETNYQNSKTLYEAGILSKSDFDKVELGYKQSKAAVEQAQLGNNQAQLANNQAQVSYEQIQLSLAQAEESLRLTTGKIVDDNKRAAQMGVNQAQASRDSVQVQLDIARSTLADTAVKAPISGVVNTKTAKAGEFTSTQMAAYTIVDMDKVKVDVKVSELLINLLSLGQEVDVYIRSIREEPLTGVITTISPAADQTSTFPVSIEIDNQDGTIKPGMFSEVRFVKDHAENAMVFPRNTVLKDETNFFVYINDNGIARKTIVEIGIDNGNEIEIRSGLTLGDQVVTKGQSYLSDGDKILVTNQEGHKGA